MTVGLPHTGFPKVMYFNRLHLEWSAGLCLVEFGLVLNSGLLDSYSTVITKETAATNQASLLEYLGRIGTSPGDGGQDWKGAGTLPRRIEAVDLITMAHRAETAETGLFVFSVAGMTAGAGSRPAITGQPLALLRSSVDLQRRLITGLYDDEAHG